MAQSTAYNMDKTRGAREDLSDQLRRVEPQETPLFSLLPSSSAPNALFTEWNVDDLGAPNIQPVLDGTDLQFKGSTPVSSAGSPGQAGNGDFDDKFVNKARMGNRIQQLRTGYTVSPLSEQIAIAGLGNIYADAKAKASLELKRSIEVMLGSDEVGASSTSTLGDISAGLGAFTNPANSAGTYWHTAGIGASASAYRPVAGSRLNMSAGGGKTLVEGFGTIGGTAVSLRAMLQAVYEASGMKANFRLFASPSIINAISDFTRTSAGSTRFNQQISGGGSVSLSVKEYESDYGTLTVIPDLFLGRTRTAPATSVANRAYLLPADDTVSVKTLQGVTAVDLPDIGGGGKRGYVTFTGTLCALNGKHLGSIV
jgi:hypothetical protein